MTHQEWLITRAETYWANDEPLPLDLFAELNAAGVDVDKEETLFDLINQYN